MPIELWDAHQHLGACTVADELAYQALPEDVRRVCARVADGVAERAREEGHAEGIDDGRQDGYDDGFADGVLEGRNKEREERAERAGFRVLVTGGRDFTNRPVVNATLTALHEARPIGTLVCGGARGADMLAVEWAIANGVKVAIYPADWRQHGDAAGPLRNQAMVATRPDHVVAFPGGAGTADCVRRAEHADIPVQHVPESTPQQAAGD